MNWLKLKLRNWVMSAHDEDESKVSNKVSRRGIAISTDSETLSTEPLRLSVYRANGGTVVESRTYDRQKDRSQTQLHIVGHDQDLGESLSKIITMEALRG
jgi:hypothetical protein